MGFKPNGQPTKRRTLLNLRRPFLNHNGVNSLNFSPETGKLVLTTGDGGSGYDPFNLSQNNIEICGKIIEIDVTKNTSVNNPPVVTRFDELPISIQETLTVMAKGVRNIPGISFQRFHNQYIKYVGNVGQDLVESIFSFVNYRPIPVTQLVQSYLKSQPEKEKFINLLNDFSIIETDYNFGSESSYYVCLGTNMNQTRLYLGVYGSFKVTDLNKGTIFEILP